MGQSRVIFNFLASLGILLLSQTFAWAQQADSSNDPVKIQFIQGDTKLQTFDIGTDLFVASKSALLDCPAELRGCTFTQRTWADPADVTLDVPAGTVVYLVMGTGVNTKRAWKSAESFGWEKVENAHFNFRDAPADLFVYKKTFDQSQQLTVTGSGRTGVIVVAKNLELANLPHDQKPTKQNPQPTKDRQPPISTKIDVSGDDPTTRISKLQSSIEALYVITEDTGEHLGLASRLIITATPGDSGKDTVPIKFTSPAGHEMYMVLDDVVRAIGVHYRVGGVKKFELSFEDKYTPKDGGSIGAAIGTLMLSVIRGFDIDPTLAITGDVTADANIRMIGGVAAKMRGAAKSGCKIVAVPTENLEQVHDALIYDGPSDLLDVQVIGVSNLDEAADVARVDRDDKLAQAISLFARIQAAAAQTPDYLFSSEAQEKLRQVLELAPNHYSASLLLAYARHDLHRLSAGATEYYISVAVKEFWDTPASRSHVQDFAATDALDRLNKLHPIGDMTVRPYLDAWIGYIQLYSRAAPANASANEN